MDRSLLPNHPDFVANGVPVPDLMTPYLLSTLKAGVCLISFVVALVFTLGSGNYWLEIFNSYVGSVPLLIIAFFELIGVIYFYGMQK